MLYPAGYIITHVFWCNLKLVQNPTNFILCLALALVFALDICTTQFAVSNGLGYEANPLMRAVVENPISSIVVKGVGLCLIIILIKFIKIKWVGHIALSLVIGITLGAVINNTMIIL